MNTVIIGGGPVSLIAAHDTVKDGFNVALFEKLARVGGIYLYRAKEEQRSSFLSQRRDHFFQLDRIRTELAYPFRQLFRSHGIFIEQVTEGRFGRIDTLQ